MSDQNFSIERFSHGAEAIDRVADAAPSEVSAEWEVLASAVQDMAFVLEESGLDTNKPMGQALQEEPENGRRVLRELQKIGRGLQDSASAVAKNVRAECDTKFRWT